MDFREWLNNNRYPFITTCVSADEWLIDYLQQHSQTVSWREFAAKTQWEDEAAILGYNVGRKQGKLQMSLSRDWSVAFDKVVLDAKHEIYFFTHSMIEYIFGTDEAWGILRQKVAETQLD